ncbi:putative cholesterol esterase [Alloactinosynnema sp. L-07]|uniref:DUF6230 family protein n=1 Tax=Alloactinosynnema sp. L-07 TaxID=1653480 RepID=UPI00065F0B60|nr:DUF6230 family protein [Alloactinosynnema sp. L-07]CRK58712.1 putative cholesterol esterase [Alloactinosynnema sp. L-07]
MHETALGRTRWGRFSVVTGVASVAIGALGFAMANGLLAASFNVNGRPFQIESAGLQGNGFGAIMDNVTKDNADGTTSGQAVARAGFETANLNGLCAAVHQSVLGLPFTLKIAAGNPADAVNDIAAADMVLDAQSVNSNASMNGLALGKSADDVALGGSATSLGGTPGNFGLQSSTANLNGLHAEAYAATIAGTINLTGLSLAIESGSTNCTIVN